MAPVEGIPDVVSAAAEAPAAATAAAPELAPEAASKIVAQVKHYFSDANLTHDGYMRKGVETDDGWVTFGTLSRFNKLRQLLGVPAEQAPKGRGKGKAPPAPVPESYVTLLAETVAAGVAESDAVEVNGDRTAVRRKAPFEASDEWFRRTVHVKGLPYGQERDALIDELTAYFGAAVGEVALLRLRRNPRTKAFKGNLLVEFATEALAEAAVAAAETLEFETHKLEPALLSAYHDEKLAANEYIQPELRKPGASYPTFEAWCAANGREVPPPLDSERKQHSQAEPEVVAGVLLKFSGADGEAGLGKVKEALGALGEVRFVELERGATEGIVRFKEPVAQTVLENNPKGALLGEDTWLALAPVDEDAQKAFFERAHAASANARGTKRPAGGRGGGRGGHRGKRGRR
ncbi:hypothetical protein IWQ57_000620 [Coemansia nantahalensis]|uniref:Uncharacterized protein n=1 Tax=Coemansia nantahalensis TaxID=2789366 RepID=A0ACC1K6X0_9FUNG|nr:hypothetical protein IWQ57_000620 [Coemansia nantahalensis]